MSKKANDPTLFFFTLTFTAIHVFVFLGLAIQGAASLWTGAFMLERVYGAIFLLIGLVFSTIFIKEWLQRYQAGSFVSLKKLLGPKKNIILLSLGLTLLTFFVQKIFFNIFLYAGFTVAGTLLLFSRLGYLQVTNLDLLDIHYEQLAWVGQFYLVYFIVNFIYTRKFTSFKLSKRK